MYQGNLAFLFAVDPAALGGDKLVAYQLIKGKVLHSDVKDCLQSIRSSGLDPDQVVTDGSAFYPEVVAEIWPNAAHQFCLFHKTHRFVHAVSNTYRQIKSGIPKAPRNAGNGVTADIRVAGIDRVRELRAQGRGIREISRMSGHSRNTITKWLRDDSFVERHLARKPVPKKDAEAIEPNLQVPAPWKRWDQVRAVSEQLKFARQLMARKSTELSPAEQEALDGILASPLAGKYNSVNLFAQKWYGIWRDEKNSRRPVDDARVRWNEFVNDKSIESFPSLVKFQNTLTDSAFERLAHHLRNQAWEATSNGAERFCRKVRHIQKQHYSFRSVHMIRHIIDRTILTGSA